MRARGRPTSLPPPVRSRWPRRLLGWAVRGVIALLALAALAAALAAFLLGTRAGSEWVVRRVVQSIDEKMPGSIEFDYRSGTLLGTIRLANVVIRDPAGFEVIRIAELSGKVELRRLLDEVARFTEVRAKGVNVTVRHRRRWIGIVRAFRDPEAPPEERRPGRWLFDLPDVHLADARVRVDLGPCALAVAFHDIDAGVVAGRGSFHVESGAGGAVDVARVGATTRSDHVVFFGTVRSRKDRPVDADLQLRQETDAASVRLAWGTDGVSADVRGGPAGIDLLRYLADVAPGLRPGTVRNLVARARGPVDDLAFAVSAESDAGGIAVDARLRREGAARTAGGRVRVASARPARLGIPAAPPDVAVSAEADFRADLSARTADARLSAVVVDGVDLPDGPQEGTLHADPDGLQVALTAADGSIAARANLARTQRAAGAWRADADAHLARGARAALPWIELTGPVDARASARWDAGGLREAAVDADLGGTAAPPASDVRVDGPWMASLGVRPLPDGGGWRVQGTVAGGETSALRLGTTVVAGPVTADRPATGASAGVPVIVDLYPDGAVHAAVGRTRVAAVTDRARDVRTSAPLSAEATAARTAAGGTTVRVALGTAGAVSLGRQGALLGPLHAAVSTGRAAGGEWRLERADASAAGARRGKVHAGALVVDIDPAGDGRSSHLRASAAGIRSGRTAVGSLSADLLGTSRAGSGTLRLTGARGLVSTTVRLRRTAAGGVDAVLEGGLVRTATAHLRFRGAVRGGGGGLEIPELVLEGQGGRGAAGGTIRGWRVLRLGATLDGFPLRTVLDVLGAPARIRRAVRAGSFSGQAVAGGTMERPLVDFSARASGVQVGGVSDAGLEIAGRFAGGDLTLRAQALLASSGRITADVAVPGAARDLVASVAASDVPVDVVRAFAPDLPRVAGTLRAGTARYDARARAVEVDATVAGLAWAQTRPVDVAVHVACSGPVCRDDWRAQGEAGLRAEGGGEIDLGEDLLAAAGRADEVIRRARMLQRAAFEGVDPAGFGLSSPSWPVGSWSGRIVVAGSPAAPEGRADLRAAGLAWRERDDLPPVDAGLRLTAGPQAVRAAGRLRDARGDRIDVVAEWPGDLAALVRDRGALLRPDLRLWGRVSGAVLRALAPASFVRDPVAALALRARWTPPAAGAPSRWSAVVSADRPFLGDVPVRSASLAVDGAGRRAGFLGAVRNDEAEALHVRGTGVLPAAPGAEPEDALPDLAGFRTLEASAAEIDAAVTARGLDVAGLPMPDVVDAATGAVDLELALRGSVASPRVSGTFHLGDGGFVVVPTAQRFERVEVSGSVDGGRVALERAAVASSGGRASVSGTIDLGAPEGAAFDLAADSSDFPLAGEGTTLGRLTCRIDVAGTAGEADGVRRVDARAELGMCTLSLPHLRSQQVLGLGDHPDFVVAGRTAARRAAEAQAAVPWDVTVVVEVPGEFWVRREDMQLAGTGTVTYRDEPGAGGGSVGGTVEVRRGWVDMLGRRFDAEFGGVDFTGRHPVDGTVDIRLASTTREGPVYVDVTGTLRHPTVQLTSDPPRDPSEIMALMYLGRTDMTSEEQVAIGQRADAVAQSVVEAVGLAFFQSEVAPRIGPLDVLRVDPGQEGLSDARLRAGMSVTRSLYVEYSYQLAADELQNSNEGRIEWLILRHLSLQGYFGDAQCGGIHLQYRMEW